MAFQIDNSDPGAILARLTPPEDPAAAQARQVQLQNARNEQSLFPTRKRQAEQAVALNDITIAEHKLDLDEAEKMKQTLPKHIKPDGSIDYQGAMAELSGQIRPNTIKSWQTFLDTHGKNAAETAKYTADADKMQQEAQAKEQEFFSGLAAHLIDGDNYTPQNVLLALSTVPPKYRDHAEQYWAAFQKDPEQFKSQLGQMITPETKERLAKLAQTQAQTAEAQQKVATGNLEMAVRSMPDQNDPNIAQAWTDWRNGLDAETQKKVKAVYSPVEYGRVRRMAVPVEKQPEFDLNGYKAQMGLVGNSEYDQFLVQYARSLGKTPKDLTPAEGLASFQKFAEFKQDPVLRANAIAMKQLTEANLRLQQGLMPTQEDIETYTTALLNHKLSPTQFNELKSRAGNVAGKVFTRAMQRDPNFSPAKAEAEFKAMEKTEADFTSGKEAGLARSLNNAIEHTGLLEQARIAMANSDIPAMARIANWFGVQAGSNLKTTYDLIARKVGDEWEKAFVPGGGGQAERMLSSEDFSSKLGDAQIKSNIRAAIHLGDSQIRNLQDQYKRGTYGQGSQELFTPAALEVRRKVLGETDKPQTQLPKPTTRGQAADAATITAYLGANNNDKDKARKALTDAGWTIPQIPQR